MAKNYTIDPYTCTKEELERAIKDCKIAADVQNANQLGAKLFLNGAYGAIGCGFYYNSNKSMAESITLQGQHLIKFSVNRINDYFKNIWHKDTDAHRKLVEIMKRKCPDFNDSKFLDNAGTPLEIGDGLQVYGDTDSAYITLQPMIELYGIPEEQQTDFCLAVNESVLAKYLDTQFDSYAQAFNCPENLENFELEKITRSLIMLSKKHYMCDVAWTDTPEYYDALSHLTFTGIEVNTGTISDVIREFMVDFIKFMFMEINNGKVPTYTMIVNKLRDMKAKFAMQDPNDISNFMKISAYENFVINDKTPVIQYYEKKENGDKLGVPIHVRAASYYNNMLYNKAKKYKNKYQMIHSGDKINYYYSKGEHDVFAFVPNAYPVEFAPEMNIDLQFEKILLEPLNRIIEAVGYNKISSSLTYSNSLF